LKHHGRVRIVPSGPSRGPRKERSHVCRRILPRASVKTVVIPRRSEGVSEDLIVDGPWLRDGEPVGEPLTIGPNANVAADLSAKGRADLGPGPGENVVASGRVELRSGCVVEGDIRALRLAVEDNAVFRGKVDLTQSISKAPDGGSVPKQAASSNKRVAGHSGSRLFDRKGISGWQAVGLTRDRSVFRPLPYRASRVQESHVTLGLGGVAQALAGRDRSPRYRRWLYIAY